MLHLVKYRGKTTLRERTTLFWSVIFSFILGTLFYLAFGNLSTMSNTIRAALVMEDDGTEATMLKTVLHMMGGVDDGLISIEDMSREEAEKKLYEDEISGIFFAGKEAELLVAENGVEQSVLQAILEQFQTRVNFISDVSREKPENTKDAVASMIRDANAVYVEESSLGGEKPDGLIQYYFALIAMTCLFGSYLGTDIAIQLQANVAAVGARRMVSATSKMKLFLCDLGTVFVADFLATVFLLCYLKFILKVEIGDDCPRMLLIILVGCLMGIAVGVWIGSMARISQGIKEGILTAVGLFSSFLSGLMINGIKGILEEFCPIVNRLNPASLITDAFYSITMYPDNARFLRDIFTLSALALILFGVAFIKMRRVCYDSI